MSSPLQRMSEKEWENNHFNYLCGYRLYIKNTTGKHLNIFYNTQPIARIARQRLQKGVEKKELKEWENDQNNILKEKENKKLI